MTGICVYCGSSPGADPAFAAAAAQVGTLIAQGQNRLIYGGGNVGLMDVVANAALAGGGEVIGVIPERLMRRELAHHGLTKLHVVDSMHERKALMASLADAFLAMPGGVGTLEEIIEVFVWTQLDFHRKPCALLNVNGFYDPLVAFLERMVNQRFLRLEQYEQWIITPDPVEAIRRLLAAKPVVMDKWQDRQKGVSWKSSDASPRANDAIGISSPGRQDKST